MQLATNGCDAARRSWLSPIVLGVGGAPINTSISSSLMNTHHSTMSENKNLAGKVAVSKLPPISPAFIDLH